MSDPRHHDAIFQYLASEYDIPRDEIDQSTLLFSDGYLDSFSMVELVAWIEKSFKVQFGVLDINLGNLDSVANISTFISSKGK